ncbi:bis(5'-nucleosyl)-tetraphosphatase (symmetrical) YqeK [Paenibacillus sp. 1P07SE]|uniref:bis(5'-nucleosyl)-tetraphosphatase (symmetrical) YqeK n=1 Tax=Paenibacillus sp. 1P07SE TaxID=3132209 RepID=UPI0039A4C9BC
MDREALKESVQAQMPTRRWEHTQGVMRTAAELVKQYGGDPEQAELAAILHDVAKYWPVEKMAETIREEGLYLEVLDHDKELWHAYAGAYAARRDYGITDQQVLDAIRYHTSGRPGMSHLEKIVWLADLIEPGRSFPLVGEIRALAEQSLERAILAGLDTTILFLIEKGKRIYPLTLLARNDLILKEAEA